MFDNILTYKSTTMTHSKSKNHNQAQSLIDDDTNDLEFNLFRDLSWNSKTRKQQIDIILSYSQKRGDLYDRCARRIYRCDLLQIKEDTPDQIRNTEKQLQIAFKDKPIFYVEPLRFMFDSHFLYKWDAYKESDAIGQIMSNLCLKSNCTH